MEKKNQVLMSVLGVFALVIVTVGVSYAFFTYTRTSQNDNTINAGELEFGFVDTEQTVLLQEAYPVLQKTATAANATTKNVVVYDFSIYYKATGTTDTEYQISLEDVTAEGATKLATDTVKVSLYSSTTSASALDNEANTTQVWNTTLATALANPTKVQLTENGTTYYRMKMWLDAGELGIAASDTNQDGVVTEDENHTVDSTGQIVSANWKDKAIAVRVKVDAKSNADGDQMFITD